MKVVFLMPGTSPLPATKGGAVENLIEELLNENEHSKQFEFTVFNVYEQEAQKLALHYKHTHFEMIKYPFFIEWADKLIYFIATRILKRNNVISYRYILRRLYVMSKYPSLLLKKDFDKVVVVTNSTLFGIFKNKKVARKYKDKVIFYLHNEVRSLFRCEEEVEAIRALIGISQFVNNSFLQKVPQLREKPTYVLKNCIDTDRFKEIDEVEIACLREKYKISSEDKVIIFAGRIVKEKGALEVIEAVKRVKTDNVKLLIVGGGFYASDVVDQYSVKLREASEEIKEKIIFTGYVNYDDMPLIYKLGDVAVLPSIWDEPAGMTMIEAAISGIPLITTRSGGISEYVSDEIAFVFERDEKLVENIADAVDYCLSNPDKIKMRLKKGIALKNELNQHNFYQNFTDILRQL